MKKRSLFLIFLIFIIACTSDEKTSTLLVERDDLVDEESSDNSKELRSDSVECEGTKIIFDYPPVNLDKTTLVVPLGLMSGSHVTPVDHQYFQNFGNDKADIEVYSPGKGVITTIQHMSGSYFDSRKNQQVEWSDFRLEIQHTCTISSAYIHIDELSEKISKFAPAKGEYTSVKIPVDAGEVIGKYANNVDYNLVDQEIVLSGLLVPEHYEAEPWKIHVPDTLEYFNEPIKNKIIEKSLRNVEPISGKLDYDIDGRLIGNWFEEGSNYYQGVYRENYVIGHLSISPNYLDHKHTIVSMGNFDGRNEQFGVKGNSPDPSTVSVESGLVKYELVTYDYYSPGGEIWDRTSLVKGLEAKNYDFVQGVILLQLIEGRKLKVEIFPNKEVVEEFTDKAKIYER